MTNKYTDNINTQQGMSFEDYKRLANLDDIAKMSHNLKPFWWENIPVIGSFIYSIRTSIKMAGIDRGLLRKKIQIQSLKFVLGGLIYPAAIIMIITPWYSYAIYKTAINKAKIEIDANNPLKV